VQSLTSNEIRTMLKKGFKATINSDDPAYFRAYMNENFIALTDEGDFSKDELVQLSRNAFDIAWLPEDRRQHYLDQLQAYANT
jgi:adenosine deaminase